MKRSELLFLFLLLVFQPLAGQVDLNENVRSAYGEIIALKIDDARSRLDNEVTDNPENLMVPYLENYIDFLTVFISEDEDEFDILEKNKSERIDRIKKLDDTSRFRNYMLGNIHLQWAVARLRFKHFFTAAIEINKAYRLLEKNAEEFPDFVPNYVSLGVLHIMIGMVPDNYQWLLDLISMKGSVEQGREELYTVLRLSRENEVYRFLYEETLFYLGFVEINIQPDPEKINILLEELEQASFDNLLLTYLEINILMRTGNNNKALQKFEDIAKSGSNFLPFDYLYYLHGDCYLRKLEPASARLKYNEFLNAFKGRNFIKDAVRKVAWSWLVEGKSAAYQTEVEKVLKMGHNDVDIDIEAEREAESGIIPNADLIKARLLFDGGYYLLADSTLAAMDTTRLTEEMQLERMYRMARTAHKSGSIDLCKSYYIKTIEEGSESDRYYAGNSALKMGEIYESEEKNQNALYYYNLCLDLDFEEYENSIHAKANAAIERLTETEE